MKELNSIPNAGAQPNSTKLHKEELTLKAHLDELEGSMLLFRAAQEFQKDNQLRQITLGGGRQS